MSWIFSLSAECGTKQTAAEQFSRYFDRVSLVLSNHNLYQPLMVSSDLKNKLNELLSVG